MCINDADETYYGIVNDRVLTHLRALYTQVSEVNFSAFIYILFIRNFLHFWE